jgi:two-component system NtrC family response regulator
MATNNGISHRILVVDDEPTVCRAIKLLLQFDGHSVQTVPGGEAALALLNQDVFDLIITDFSMEGMKGDQLAAIIKQRWPGQPVIMATAFAADLDSSGQSSDGVDCVLSKPFSLTELRAAIASVMSRNDAPAAKTASSASLPDESQLRPPPLPLPELPRESSSGRSWL